ncbi:hypothetical protein R1sor_019727 [Riccia sorocarpa]|uniref:SWIM-type domain-containing protein n=1 Tax=Riccia sorocarpa TaxID=122646 RepID=A0ABD3IH51_9MARC
MPCLQGESKLFLSIPVFVVNWVSRPPHPNKFTYIACSKDVGGQRCMTSVGGRSLCTHRGAAITIAYRFDVMLTDGSRQGKPVKATLFEAASALLGDIYPSTFQALPAEEQQSLVDRVCYTRHLTRHATRHAFTHIDLVAEAVFFFFERLKTVSRGEKSARRPVQSSDETDYLRLRSTLPARWKINRRRKLQNLKAHAYQTARLVMGPALEAPADTIYTVMLKKLIELKQERGEFSVNSDFECECLASAVRDSKGGIEVHRWCKDLLEKTIPRSADDESPVYETLYEL